MANYQQLKQSIANVIKTNGNKAITGAILQNVLQTIVSSIGENYTFGGVAETTASPGTPDANIFWLAGAGTYVNMGNITIPANHIGVIMWNGSWSSSSLPVGGGQAQAQFASGEDVGNVTLSSTVGNNDNLVRGRGIYSALQGKQDKINDLATIRTNAEAGAEAKTMATEIRNHVDGFIVRTEMDNVYDFVDKVRLTSRYAVLNAQTSTETNSVVVGILDMFGQDSAKFVLTQVYTTSQTMTDGVLNNQFRYGKTYQYVRYKARNASGASSLNAALGTSIAAGEWTGWYYLHEGVEIVNDLTTGGTQVALSAEMGKNLNTSLTLMQTAVNGISDSLAENTDKDGQHNVAEFGGFIETNISVEMTSPVASVTPSNVLFSTARNLFVARIGLRYYQSWAGSGVGSADYQSGAEPHAGKVFTYNGKTYQYNPATSQLVNVGVEVVEVDWNIPTTAAYADVSNSAEAYQVAKGQAILQRVRRLMSYGNNVEVRLPITSGYARHFEILNETDNLTICWLVRCAERLVQARLLPTGRIVIDEV